MIDQSGSDSKEELVTNMDSWGADRASAWAEVHDPTTTSVRLAELVGHYPEFATAAVDHPNCYPELADWARANDLLGPTRGLGPVESAPMSTEPVPPATPSAQGGRLTGLFAMIAGLALVGVWFLLVRVIHINFTILPILGGIAVIGGIYFLVTGTGSNRPTEPPAEPTAAPIVQPPMHTEAVPVDSTVRVSAVPTSSAPARPRSRRWLIPVAGAAVTVVVLSGAFLLLPRGGVAVSGPVASSSPAVAEATPSASPSALPRGSSVAFTCWNGRGADGLDSCGRATGTAGLKYIYPSLNDQWDRCKYVDYRPTTATYDCQLDEGVIRYRYWKDSAEAEQHYLEKYTSAEISEFNLDGRPVGTMYRATKRDKKGIFSMTAHWGDGHYSLSVDAKSRAQQDELWGLVTFRAVADLQGYASDGMPGEAQKA